MKICSKLRESYAPVHQAYRSASGAKEESKGNGMTLKRQSQDLSLIQKLEGVLHPLGSRLAQERFDPLLEQVGDASFVLLGEASHGTHQFYAARAEITQHLIEKNGFNAVAVEADWPDAYRVNRYVQHRSQDQDAVSALGDFTRFPRWMWRNQEVASFVEWLRVYNEPRAANQRVGFFGLDLYSLYNSIQAVLAYLDSVDPEAAQKARYRYSCFEQFEQDPQQYGYAANFGVSEDCENQAVEQLIDLRQRALIYLQRDGFVAQDEQFYAEQNARLVRNAEQYYREMFRGRDSSWNLRDRHMFETLAALANHLRRQGRDPRIVVWAHNSHLGDARFTEMSSRGELNLGQLVKENYGLRTCNVGFTTYAGTVAAASDWGGDVERKEVRPGLKGSYEALFHEVKAPAFYLNLSLPAIETDLHMARLQRAIGVIYRPQTERASHYFYAHLSRQFDAVIHFDHSDAVTPLEQTSGWDETDLPETYPTGI
jgi:erythromycin esterase-like protein